MRAYRVLGTFLFVIWIITELWGGSKDPEILWYFGANFRPSIAQGEYWRFFTSSLLHAGILHLVLNLVALRVMGISVEGISGFKAFLSLFIITGTIGAIASWAGSFNGDNPYHLSVGASGGIAGLFGWLAGFIYSNRSGMEESRRREVFKSIGTVIGMNVIFALMVPNVDNYCHAGGFFSGFLLGISGYFDPRKLFFGRRLLMEKAGWLVSILIVIYSALGWMWFFVSDG